MKQRVISALIMGVITTGTVSFTLIGVNRGYAAGFAWVWLRSWAIAYVIVIPIILILSPVVQRFVGNLCKEKERAYAKQGA
ncbi:MAG: DUF2798 domain-containing protein [Cytophagales bacterium]|nr:DUF2798 domain-containing protein [Cytophagales bacterium]